MPVVSLCLGSVAGLGAARVVTSHYSVMVKGTSHLFVAGPPVVARLGEDVDKETLGGSAIHTRNGVVDDEAATEAEAIARPRASSRTCRRRCTNGRRAEPEPTTTRPTGATNGSSARCRAIAARCTGSDRSSKPIVDRDSFMELGRHFGGPAVTGLARLHGWPVAVLANDPYHYGGGWTAAAAQKVTRFVDLADTFGLPVVHFVDNPGFVIGTDAEHAATIRHGARALAAIYEANVPWCSVILRKVYGVAGAAHQNASRLSYRYAWPSGNWGSLPLEGGIEAAYRAELEAAPDPAARRAEIEQRLTARQSPFRTAEAFLVEEIIDPRDTRRLLCEFAELAAPLWEPGLPARGTRP